MFYFINIDNNNYFHVSKGEIYFFFENYKVKKTPHPLAGTGGSNTFCSSKVAALALFRMGDDVISLLPTPVTTGLLAFMKAISTDFVL